MAAVPNEEAHRFLGRSVGGYRASCLLESALLLFEHYEKPFRTPTMVIFYAGHSSPPDFSAEDATSWLRLAPLESLPRRVEGILEPNAQISATQLRWIIDDKIRDVKHYLRKTTLFTCNDNSLLISNLRHGLSPYKLRLDFRSDTDLLGFIRQIKGYVGKIGPGSLDLASLPDAYKINLLYRRRLRPIDTNWLEPALIIPLLPLGSADPTLDNDYYKRRNWQSLSNSHTFQVRPPEQLNTPAYWPIFMQNEFLHVYRALEFWLWYPETTKYFEDNNHHIIMAIESDKWHGTLKMPLANVFFEEPFHEPPLHLLSYEDDEIVSSMPFLQTAPFVPGLVEYRRQRLGLIYRAVTHGEGRRWDLPNAPAIFGDVEPVWCMLIRPETMKMTKSSKRPKWALILMPLKIEKASTTAFTTVATLLPQRLARELKNAQPIIVTTEQRKQIVTAPSGIPITTRFIRYFDPQKKDGLFWGITFRPADIAAVTSIDSFLPGNDNVRETREASFKRFVITRKQYTVIVDKDAKISAEIECFGNSFGQRYIRLISEVAVYRIALDSHENVIIWPTEDEGPPDFHIFLACNAVFLNVQNEQRLIIDFGDNGLARTFARMFNMFVKKDFDVFTARTLEETHQVLPYFQRETGNRDFPVDPPLSNEPVFCYGPSYLQIGRDSIVNRFERASKDPSCSVAVSKGIARMESQNVFAITRAIIDATLKADTCSHFFEAPFNCPHPMRKGAYAHGTRWFFDCNVDPPDRGRIREFESRLARSPQVTNIVSIQKVHNFSEIHAVFGYVIDTSYAPIPQKEPLGTFNVRTIRPILLAMPSYSLIEGGISFFQTVALMLQDLGDEHRWMPVEVVVVLTEMVSPNERRELPFRTPVFGNVRLERWARVVRLYEERYSDSVSWVLIPYFRETMKPTTDQWHRKG